MLAVIYGCDKERIVTTTETVHETEYIELPQDTILMTDSFFVNTTDTFQLISTDTFFVNTTDTFQLISTDTVTINTTDTMTIYDTLHITHILIDTVEMYQTLYDTVMVTVTDTVVQDNQTADEYYAYTALQFHTDPAVLQFINSEFGIAEGWIFYLSTFQNTVANPSAGVYDFTGFIDYWVPDWSSYYPLEYAWRVSFNGGDPSNPSNWSLSDPPGVVSGQDAGISLVKERVNISHK